MAIVLDTDRIDPGDRADVVATVVQEISAPSHLVYDPADGPIQAHFEAWELGQVGLHRMRMSGFRLVRTPKQVRVSPSSLFSIAVQRDKSSRLTQNGIQHETSSGDLFFVDIDRPYDLHWRGGKATVLLVPVDQLRLSVETIRTAIARPQCSPLYPLVVNHLALMDDSAELLHNDPAATALGDSCLHLARTLLISAAARGNEDGTALPADILLAQIRGYVRRRLADPDLDAPRIARAHSISVRYLYKVCARADLRLEQWIIAERLERVRGDLARPEFRHRSIASIAFSHGFRHPSHLTRRFRAAYGTAPSEWRRAALEQRAGSGFTADAPAERKSGR